LEKGFVFTAHCVKWS